MPYRVDVFDRAVRKKDSEFHLVVGFFTDCAVYCPLPLGSILRMNAAQPFFPTRHALFGIEAIDPIPFLGEMRGFSVRHSPDPASCMCQPLRFGQVSFASPQCFFRTLAVADVHHRSAKLDAVRFGIQGMSYDIDVLDPTIRRHQTKFMLKILSVLRRALNDLFHRGQVLWMDPLENKFYVRCRGAFVFEDSNGFL